MKCTVCENQCLEYGAKLLTIDGDFACSDLCKEQYEKERDHFLNTVIHDDQLFSNWLGVDISEIKV